jgi:hypothetical protein
MAWPIPHPQEMESKRYGKFTCSFHAMKQFYSRYLKVHADEMTQEQKDSVEFFYNKFCKNVKNFVEVERRNAIWQVIKYDLQEARYFRNGNGYGNWIFVTAPNQHILTCFRMTNCDMYKAKKAVDKKRNN